MQKTILLTGTNRGIGLGFVEHFTALGANVIATHRPGHASDQLLSLNETNANLTLHALDVSDVASIDNFAQALQGQNIDIFINNAGVYGSKGQQSFHSVDLDEWKDVLMVNTLAPLLLTRALHSNLKMNNGAICGYISSKMGSIDDNSSGGQYIYRSSKSSLNSVVRSLSVDLADDQIQSVALHPGWVKTDMGGPNALIDVKTSVNGLADILLNFKQAYNGSFLNYDGQTIPW
ncbi:SDR family oxidoreductase [Algicola sagamiensis]|uniref:SDR family oxidoreductase n=1 Tax=Algicola sagamiensis TaxID=163869 RepID=UPI0003745526|nr:SDR family oxidoreductase [Algicola sagamiensis]